MACKEMQRRVMALIGEVENRELTEILLDVNDNLNNQMLRYERYKGNVQNNPTSTDEVLLELAAGGQELQDLDSRGAAAPPPTARAEYQVHPPPGQALGVSPSHFRTSTS